MTPTGESRRWLVDKSALVRLGSAPNADEWANRINRGLVHIATVTLLEVGFSARTAEEHRLALQHPPVAAMPVENATPAIERRAVAVNRFSLPRTAPCAFGARPTDRSHR